MSVRAYKILKTEDNHSFNLTCDSKIIDIIRDTGEYKEDEGLFSVSVLAINTLLKSPLLDKEFKDSPQAKQLKKDIRGLDDNDWIDYLCY